MRLQIGLRHDEYAVSVAQFIEHVLIGIVRISYRCDVVCLAKLYVFFYQFGRHRMTVVGMEFMTVDAVYLDDLAVELYKRSSAVFHRLYFDFSKTKVRTAGIFQLAACIKPDFNVIKIGIFMRPK